MRKPLPIPRFAVCLFFFSPLPGLVARSDGAAVIKLLNDTEVILSVRRSLFFDAFLVESCWIFERKLQQELSTSKHLYLGAFFYLVKMNHTKIEVIYHFSHRKMQQEFIKNKPHLTGRITSEHRTALLPLLLLLPSFPRHNRLRRDQ